MKKPTRITWNLTKLCQAKAIPQKTVPKSWRRREAHRNTPGFLSACVILLGAFTTHHRWGVLNNRDLFSQSGDQKSKIKVLAGLVTPEAPLLGLAFSLCPHTVFFFFFGLCANIPSVSLCVQSFSDEDTSH